ncbi:MAG: endo-1,4-beta-xylanase [Clostridia bacterium]|nr:endo-1,4-beta-xylanase [Clostridia bacterium]
MKLKHLFAILMSLILVFSFGGCIFTNDSGENLEWDSRSSYFEIEKGANGVVTVSYKIKEGKDNSVYADVSDYDDPETYINLTLSADVATKTQVVIKYRESGENKTASVNIKIEEESEVFSFDLTKITKKGMLKTISLYPKYDKTSGSGELKIEKVKFSDECNEDNEFIMKESTSSDNGGNTVTPTNPTDVIDVPSGQEEMLYAKYKDYFRIGMVANADREGNYTSYSKIESEFNSFTCENEMKMYTIAYGDEYGNFNYRDPNAYNFQKADAMISYYQSRGIKVRGHALIWYNGCPSWFGNEGNESERINKIRVYCQTVVSHFADRFGDTVYCWDVVNEAVGDEYIESANKNKMREFWYCQPKYVAEAFKVARETLDSKGLTNVKLYYNDYNTVQWGSKWTTVSELITSAVNDFGAPIDGIGFQSHFNSGSDAVNTNDWVGKAEQAIKNCNNLSNKLGRQLEISITELDVKTSDNTALADFYGKLFAVYRKYAANIASVTLWGAADGHSWLGNNYTPFLFDRNQNKKAAYYSVYNF